MTGTLKRGTTVGLNLPKRIYFFQGEGGINLVAGKEESAIIPESISDKQLEMIRKAVRLQHLVIEPGEKKDVSKAKQSKDSDIEKILKKGRNAVKDYIYSVIDDKGKASEEKIAILEEIAELEKKNDNRKSVLDSIESALDKLAGVSPVQETETESVQIQLS